MCFHHAHTQQLTSAYLPNKSKCDLKKDSNILPKQVIQICETRTVEVRMHEMGWCGGMTAQTEFT